jgi:hypothetical protein
MDEVLREAIVSDTPIMQDVVIPPPTIPLAEEVRTNVNLS